MPLLLVAQTASISGVVRSETKQKTLPKVDVYLQEMNELQQTNKEGEFRFEALVAGEYTLLFSRNNYQAYTEVINLKKGENKVLTITMKELQIDLPTLEIEAEDVTAIGARKMRDVEGAGIYAAKKSEVVEIENIVANKAVNNAREVYKNVAGLNIWESDGAGLQLSIGARGLDPNRTSNFNTRQNGYDISADALGYPESYYTPPTQALERIEIVRGAASLQFGPQFGGLLNFVFKKGKEDKTLSLTSENTVGSFGLFSTFNSVGGSKKGYNYYGFYQRKQGNAWRPNSQFYQNTAYLHLDKQFSEKLSIGLEYTYMNYLAQQAGGLVDFEFEQDARQSKRARNWFQVNWNLAALHVDYQFSQNTSLNSRSFALLAKREALGNLKPINRPDPLTERDLIEGRYRNFGNETRLIHRYNLGTLPSTFLAGVRYYQGLTNNRQGFASDSTDADFRFLNPNNLEHSEYRFPSRNISFFVENLFNITPKWSLTPGVRFEYIKTASDGYFKSRFTSGGVVLLESKTEDAKENKRSLALLGIGTGYKLRKELEMYANFSQNYRSINFSDLAVVNPNLVVDSLLTDERGFNMDVGIRGHLFQNRLLVDVSLFYLNYQNRIGTGELIITDDLGIQKAVAYRTNIGDARILGAEMYSEFSLWRQLNEEQKIESDLSVFLNTSILDGKYVSGESNFVGNKVELIPPLSLKTGFQFKWKGIGASYQFSYVSAHFSDATNAEQVADATRGLIPTYSVQDVSLSYTHKWLKVQGGINNLLNASYFTRRAAAYPGPGIIPADGRSFYVTVGVAMER